MALARIPSLDSFRELNYATLLSVAVRCAKRVESVVLNSHLTDEHKRSVSNAIQLAERHVNVALPVPYVIPSEAVLAAISDIETTLKEVSLKSADAKTVAIFAAIAAAGNALKTTIAKPDEVAELARNAAIEATAAAQNDNMSAEIVGVINSAMRGVSYEPGTLITIDSSSFVMVDPTVHFMGSDKIPGIGEYSIFPGFWSTDKTILSKISHTSDWTADPGLNLWIEPGNASTETLERVLVALSDLNLAASGSSLKFESDGDFIFVREAVLA